MSESNTEPVVKKKASFIERLKLRTKRSVDTTLSTEELMPKSRVAYKPQHAASDFSKVTVSPHIPPRGSSAAIKSRSKTARSKRQDTVPTMALQAKPDELQPEKQKRESRPAPAHKSSRSVEGRSQAYQLPPQTSHSNPEARRCPQAMQEQPQQSAGAAEDLLIDVAPMKPPLRPDEATGTVITETPVKQDPPAQSVEIAPLIPPSDPPSGRDQPSDFEIFMAQAEATDRAQRKLAWKALQQRSVSAPIVRPNPHRQYVNNTAPVDVSGHAGDGSRAYQISQRDSGKSALELIEETRKAQARLKALHANGGQASPSIEKRKEQVVVVTAVDDKARPVGPPPEDQNAGTLRHQSSFAKKLVEYIKPPREERRLGHSGSKLSMRRAGQSQGD